MDMDMDMDMDLHGTETELKRIAQEVINTLYAPIAPSDTWELGLIKLLRQALTNLIWEERLEVALEPLAKVRLAPQIGGFDPTDYQDYRERAMKKHLFKRKVLAAWQRALDEGVVYIAQCAACNAPLPIGSFDIDVTQSNALSPMCSLCTMQAAAQAAASLASSADASDVPAEDDNDSVIDLQEYLAKHKPADVTAAKEPKAKAKAKAKTKSQTES